MFRIILALLILFPLLAQAETGYQMRHTGLYYKTGQDACNAGIADAQAFEPYRNITAASWVTGGCRFTTVRKSDGYTQYNQNLRCTQAGTVCYVDSHVCTAGEPASVTWPLGVKDPATDAVPQAEALIPPWPVCSEGCMVQKVSAMPFTSSCFGLQDENPLKVYCDFNGTQTGSACATSDEPTQPELPECPGGYTNGPTGCVKDTPPDPCATDPQAEGCPGTGGGDPDPDPCQTDPQAEGCTGGGDTGGGDTGGGDTGGGDTGGGDTGGGDTGGGDTGGGDTGGGDTGGGDTGTDDGAASGTDCGTALSCTGDAVGCAIARIQKDFSCAMQDDGDFPAQKDELKQLLGDPQLAPVEDDEINVGELFDRGTRFLPSACPPPESLSLITNGGRAFEISYQPLCQLASDLGYLIVVAASIFYALYVGRSVGGE